MFLVRKKIMPDDNFLSVSHRADVKATPILRGFLFSQKPPSWPEFDHEGQKLGLSPSGKMPVQATPDWLSLPVKSKVESVSRPREKKKSVRGISVFVVVQIVRVTVSVVKGVKSQAMKKLKN